MADGTPQGRLLAAALDATRPKLTKVAVARRAGITVRGLRNILDGKDSNGRPAPGMPFTVARIALVVGVTADELRAVGRDDAAERWESLRGAPGCDPEVWLRGVRAQFDNDADFVHYVLSVVSPTGATSGAKGSQRNDDN